MHDLRHASASWALAGGATVQQVREHLGHVSLRAVERYLHSLPGADNGAAGAIARVKETGTLYPVITPSYTPVPPVPATGAASALPLTPEAMLEVAQSRSFPVVDAEPVPAAEPPPPVANSAPGVSRAARACVGVPEEAVNSASGGGAEHVVGSAQPSEGTGAHTVPPCRSENDSDQRSRKKQHGKLPGRAEPRGLNRRDGGRHADNP